MTTVATRLALAESAMQRSRPPEQAAFLTETYRIFRDIWDTGKAPVDADPAALAIVLRLDARV